MKMMKYTQNPKDIYNNYTYGNLLGEEFIELVGDRDVPVFVERVGITYPDKDYFVKRKHSNYITLEYVIEGKGYVEINNKVQEVVAGDIYLLLPGSSHKYWADEKEPFKKIWINAYSGMLASMIHSLRLNNQTVFHAGKDFLPLFEQMLKIAQTNNINDFVYHDFTKIIVNILVDLSASKDKSFGEDTIATYTRAFINNQIYNNPTVQQLAKRLFVTETYLIRCFKKEYGITPHQYLINKKISLAKSMLLNSKMTVGEIASLLSFDNEHYFSALFKKKTGMTPTAVRNAGKDTKTED